MVSQEKRLCTVCGRTDVPLSQGNGMICRHCKNSFPETTKTGARATLDPERMKEFHHCNICNEDHFFRDSWNVTTNIHYLACTVCGNELGSKKCSSCDLVFVPRASESHCKLCGARNASQEWVIESCPACHGDTVHVTGAVTQDGSELMCTACNVQLKILKFCHECDSLLGVAIKKGMLVCFTCQQPFKED